MVDLVVGPDAYKDIPNLLKRLMSREAVNVILSKERPMVTFHLLGLPLMV